MNKTYANILIGACLIASVFITSKALGFAEDLAYSGTKPLLWVNVVAFFASVALVVLAVYVKARYVK